MEATEAGHRVLLSGPDQVGERGRYLPMAIDRVQTTGSTAIARREGIAEDGGDATETGAAAPDGDTRSEPRAPTGGQPRRTARWLWLVYAVVVVIVAVAITDTVTAHGALSRTDAALQVEQARLQQADRTLLAVHRELIRTDGLADDAARTLTAETAQLTSVRAELTAAEADQFDNGVSIADLTTCLSGVQQALNQISLGDAGGAAASLNGVASTCRAAEPSG